MLALKLIPHLLSWIGIVLVLLRGFSARRSLAMAAAVGGLVTGVIGTAALQGSFSPALPYTVIKSALGVSFLLFWGISVAAIYRGTGRNAGALAGGRFCDSAFFAAAICALAGMVAGAVCACRLPAIGGGALSVVLLSLLATALAYAASFGERRLPASFQVSQLGMLAGLVSLLLFTSSSLPRLDLFAPLSMKVMKGIHDFIHQFMESILMPDHLFVTPLVWKFLGFLFGKEVGFWGGIVIWFTPALLIALALASRRLPSVAHIRQGAERRKLLAAAVRGKRLQLFLPLFSTLVFAAAAYQSSFPTVEYWDPKPLPVTANPAGEIFIPKKGEVDLEDGQLHKYLFKQGGRQARFFVLMSPAGQLTVDLDACAICQPDGYGQAEGTVICYYCKTLIPLETVGRPGGCNPVPVPFAVKPDGVVIDALRLINSWSTTVQATTRVKEGGK